jgi:tetratricopeptide (TPR) repeat protein
LLDQLAFYREAALAAYAPARLLCERALAIRKKTFGPDHPGTAASLNNLAQLLQDQGELAAARPRFERALAICEVALGPDHPDTATSLHNLAMLLQVLGELAAARPLFERSLAIRERALGPDHPDKTTVRNNLASLSRGVGCKKSASILDAAGRRSSNSRRLLFDARPWVSARPARKPICDRSRRQKISRGRAGPL